MKVTYGIAPAPVAILKTLTMLRYITYLPQNGGHVPVQTGTHFALPGVTCQWLTYTYSIQWTLVLD